MGVVWIGLQLRDTTTPVTVADAVDDFESTSLEPIQDAPSRAPEIDESSSTDQAQSKSATQPVAPIESTPSEPPTTTAPEPIEAGRPLEEGVYVYSTTGGEEIDALGGTRHDYPVETTLTVQAGGCGLIVRWQPLRERFEEMELCLGDQGPEISGYTSFHQFFGNDERRDFSCEPAIAFAATADAESTSTCAADGLTESVTKRGLGTRTFTAGTDRVEAIGVALSATISGESWGTTEAEMWVTPGGLIVSWSETVETDAQSFVGDVHYSEQFSLELTAADPVR